MIGMSERIAVPAYNPLPFHGEEPVPDFRTEGEFLLAWLARLTGRLRAAELSGGTGGRAVILAYHRVLPVGQLAGFRYLEDLVTSAERFSVQMALLAERFRVLPLQEMVRMLVEGEGLPAGSVALTFDDGYADNYLHALPVLRRHNLPATIFLATDYVGGASGLYWWDEISRWRASGLKEVDLDGRGRRPLRTRSQRDRLLSELKRLPADETREIVTGAARRHGMEEVRNSAADFLTWSQVREMRDDRISFGSHTASHCLLPVETPQRRERELRESRARLERETGAPCELFCHPDGAATAETARAAEAAGYRAAFVTRARDLRQEPGMDRYRLPRKSVNYRAAETVFRFRLSPLPEAIKRGRDRSLGSAS
jgi:peptidoglycan/xylan/chitin deacetylase (PgdA/CDA1 family)